MVALTLTVPFAVLAGALNVTTSLSASVAVTLPVTTPVVVFGVPTVAVPNAGARLGDAVAARVLAAGTTTAVSGVTTAPVGDAVAARVLAAGTATAVSAVYSSPVAAVDTCAFCVPVSPAWRRAAAAITHIADDSTGVSVPGPVDDNGAPGARSVALTRLAVAGCCGSAVGCGATDIVLTDASAVVGVAGAGC